MNKGRMCVERVILWVTVAPPSSPSCTLYFWTFFLLDWMWDYWAWFGGYRTTPWKSSGVWGLRLAQGTHQEHTWPHSCFSANISSDSSALNMAKPHFFWNVDLSAIQILNQINVPYVLLGAEEHDGLTNVSPGYCALGLPRGTPYNLSGS